MQAPETTTIFTDRSFFLFVIHLGRLDNNGPHPPHTVSSQIRSHLVQRSSTGWYGYDGDHRGTPLACCAIVATSVTRWKLAQTKPNR